MNVENAENVSENMAFLEQFAQKGDVAANLFLGVIYNEGIAENGDIQNPTVIIPMDWEKSNFYLEKCENPVSPIYNQEKALEWAKKHAEFKKEFGAK